MEHQNNIWSINSIYAHLWVPFWCFLAKGILLDPLDAKKAMKSYLETIDKSDDHEHKGNLLIMNCLKCYDFVNEL